MCITHRKIYLEKVFVYLQGKYFCDIDVSILFYVKNIGNGFSKIMNKMNK